MTGEKNAQWRVMLSRYWVLLEVDVESSVRSGLRVLLAIMSFMHSLQGKLQSSSRALLILGGYGNRGLPSWEAKGRYSWPLVTDVYLSIKETRRFYAGVAATSLHTRAILS